MIHAAIMGSIERFLSVLIEHYAGAFPLWLSPVQISLLPIGEDHIAYAERMRDALKHAGIRVEVDTSARSIGAKIRTSTLQKVPCMGIIGDKEMQSESVALRLLNGQDAGTLSIESLIKQLHTSIENHS